MRVTLYIVILTLLVFAPVECLDVANLQPVQTVALSIKDQRIVIQTDTKDKGSGDTLEMAIHNLKKNVAGVVYLDTAQYLLVTEETVDYVETLQSYLRPTVKVSLWDGKGSVEKAAEFLEIRRDLPTLRRWDQERWNPVEKS